MPGGMPSSPCGARAGCHSHFVRPFGFALQCCVICVRRGAVFRSCIIPSAPGHYRSHRCLPGTVRHPTIWGCLARTRQCREAAQPPNPSSFGAAEPQTSSTTSLTSTVTSGARFPFQKWKKCKLHHFWGTTKLIFKLTYQTQDQSSCFTWKTFWFFLYFSTEAKFKIIIIIRSEKKQQHKSSERKILQI